MKENTLLIFGKSWTGKTTRLFYELRDEPRVVLVDPKCAQLARLEGWGHFWPEYSEEHKAWVKDGGLVGFFRSVRFGASDHDSELSKAFSDRVSFRVVVHFRSFHRENLELLSLLLAQVGNLVLAVDELSLFVPPGAPTAFPPALTSLVVSGTHEGLRFVGTAQRPNAVHNTPKALAQRILFYRITEKNDLAAAGTYLPAGFVEELERLPDQACIDWSDGREPFTDLSLIGKLDGFLPVERFDSSVR